MITLAVSKGRILNEFFPLLEAIGCAPCKKALESRSLIIPTADLSVRIIIVRAQDVPTFVSHGAATAGVTGSDVIAEKSYDNLYQPLNLGIARCRLVVATKEGFDYLNQPMKITVATKYLKLARQFFNRRGVSANYIKLHGTMELAPLVNLADVIIDLADTGDTLRAHGLQEVELIQEVSSMFITNRVTADIDYDLERFQSRLTHLVGNK